MSETQGTKRAAEPDPSNSGIGISDGGSGGGGGGGLYGLTTVQKAFHFLPDPADILRAATACRRWRELAGADSVWRARFEREGLVDKARLFEVALPVAVQAAAAGGGSGGGGGSSSSAAAESEGELAGVGLAFYAQVFALKVRVASLARHLAELAGAGAGSSRVRLTTARTRRARLLCRGAR